MIFLLSDRFYRMCWGIEAEFCHSRKKFKIKPLSAMANAF